MSTWLTIAGAFFEAVGLAVVFIELAVIRSHEFGVSTPWARLAGHGTRLSTSPGGALELCPEPCSSPHPASATVRGGDYKAALRAPASS